MSNALSASSENVDYGKVSVPWQLIWESTGGRRRGGCSLLKSRLVEEPGGHIAYHQHDPSPVTGDIDHWSIVRLHFSNLHDQLGDTLRVGPQYALLLDMSSHRRIDEAKLNQHRTCVGVGQPVRDPLH